MFQKNLSEILILQLKYSYVCMERFHMIVLKIKLLIFIALIWLCDNADAQNLGAMKFDSYTSEIIRLEHGMSQNTVQCLLEDSRGFIWIGTWDGLNRFDGYSFRIFRPNIDNSNESISNETINDLFEDNNGNIWIATDKGLNLYNYKDESFTHYYYSFIDENTLPSDSIAAIEMSSDGRLWIGTNRGLCVFDRQFNVFYTYKYNQYNQNTLSGNYIQDLYLDQHNVLWVATNSGLTSFDINNNSFKRFQRRDNQLMAGDTIYDVIGDKQGNIWMATSNGLSCFNPMDGEWKLYRHKENDNGSIPSNNVLSLLCDRQNRIWVGTQGGGLSVYNSNNDSFITLSNEEETKYGLSNNYVQDILQAQNGDLWIGTWRGLNKYSPFAFKFEHFQIAGKDLNSNANLVWAFLEVSQNQLLVGTEYGLFVNDITKQSISPFKLNPMTGKKIRSIYPTESKGLMVGTLDEGLFILDAEGRILKQFVPDPNNQNSIAGLSIWCIDRDSQGNYWFGTNGGLSMYDVKLDSFTNFRSLGYDDKSTISNNSVYGLMIDKQDIVWICTYNGLNRYDPKKHSFFTFRHDPLNPLTISNDRIFSIVEDNSGILWIGTMGGGLNRYDRKTGEFSSISTINGLADNVVYNIIIDAEGYLWLTTNKGLCKYHPPTGRIVNYDINEGIQSHEFNMGAAYLLNNGQIAVGGMNGYNVFDPSKIRVNGSLPRMAITQFLIFGKPYSRFVEDGDTIFLDYDDNFFSFRFSAMDFTNPSKNQYAFKLVNFDKDWILTNANRREADYTEVPPGKYVFRVKASNSEGVWNEKGISIHIVIRPPYWQTWYFRSGLVFLIIFISFLFIRSQVKRVRKRSEFEGKMLEIEKQLFELEQKALRLQMNPHFIFNSLNSIQSFVIANDTERAINYLAKFSHLMRLILSTSRESIIPVNDELRLLNYYLELESLRFQDKFSHSIIVDPKIDKEFTGIPPMIIQPYIENAIIHGLMNKLDGKGEIIIQFRQKEEYIICLIEDNGIGREKAAQIKAASGLGQKSQGMLITKERLEILNRKHKDKISVEIFDLKDNFGNASGTRVKLIIPASDL